MQIGKVSTGITVEERAKVAGLPVGDIAYLEIPKVAELPGTAEEGEVYQLTTDGSFHLWVTDHFEPVLFSMEPM
ncbi:hypothetical protein ES708_24106 [subsurface metagenome]